MKLAVIKLGSRIAIGSNGTSGGTGEALSVIKILVKDGHDVTVFTKISSKDESPSSFSILDIEENYLRTNGYDALLVMNGNVNFFGGAEDRSQILNYHIINNFKGKVFYILCDPALVLTQLWKSIEKKPWGASYKKEDIYISREDIKYICQARNTDMVKETANKHVVIKNVRHFPFEKFPLLTLTNSNIDFSKCKYQISYGGTFRGGKRDDDMAKFYFGYDIPVEMFGKIDFDKFDPKVIDGLNPPTFNPPVPYEEFHERMKQGISTIIIGDPLYKKLDNLAQRIYESIRIGNIVFIDESYDYNHRVFSSPALRKFSYVNSREDVLVRLQILFNDPSKMEKIVKLQRKDAEIDLNEYAAELTKLFF